MHYPELRASQLIMSFGPGALVDLPESSVIMGGLEQWQYDREIEEHCWISESRLTSKLEEWLKGRGIPYAAPLRLKTPPPKMEGRNGQSFGRVDAFIFPEWFVAKTDEVNPDNGRIRSRLFHIRDLENTKSVKVGTKRFGLVPMRFVKACPRGHVSDVDWGRFVPHREQGCGGEQNAGVGPIPRVGDRQVRILGRVDRVGQIERHPLASRSPDKLPQIGQHRRQELAASPVDAGGGPSQAQSGRVVLVGVRDDVVFGLDRQNTVGIGRWQGRSGTG